MLSCKRPFQNVDTVSKHVFKVLTLYSGTRSSTGTSLHRAFVRVFMGAMLEG